LHLPRLKQKKEVSELLFDSHAHLNDPELYKDLEDVLTRAKEAGVGHIASIGYDWPSSLMNVRLAEKYPDMVHAVIGIHPHDAKIWDEKMSQKIYELARSADVVAIGEIGLDYYRNLSPKEDQIRAFVEQIKLARELSLPIVIHDRDAHGDVMRILKQERGGVNGGIIHCFSGSWEMAEVCMRLGFEISFAGPITYTNARSLVEVAKKVPLAHLLIETDCPYLSPHPYRGKNNEPARVSLVARKLSEICGIDIEQITKMTTENAIRVYRIKNCV